MLATSQLQGRSIGERSIRVLPGQYYDAETGTHYNAARDYDPTIGRYVESDPIGLRGGPNTYSYVKSDPARWTDPSGRFVPGWHSRMSLDALADCPKLRLAGAFAAWQVDWLDGSQDPAQANWHGMCRPGQSAAQGLEWIQSMIDYQIKTCSVEGLGRALHAAQDMAARGHKGCQQWNGFTWGHIVGDWDPTPEEIAEAMGNSRNVIRRFKANCPCTCD